MTDANERNAWIRAQVNKWGLPISLIGVCLLIPVVAMRTQLSESGDNFWWLVGSAALLLVIWPFLVRALARRRWQAGTAQPAAPEARDNTRNMNIWTSPFIWLGVPLFIYMFWKFFG